MVIQIVTTPSIPALPKFEDKKKIDVRYMLLPPFASAHIHWDDKIHELVYNIEEPTLNEYEKAVLAKLEEAMLELININVAVEKTLEATTTYLDKTARLLIDELNIKVTPDAYNKLFYYLYRDFIGMNEIDPLLHDYFIEDIECNGVESPVYVIHRVYRNLRTTLTYHDVEHLASFVEKLAQRAGRYISYAQPLLDGSLPDGSRVNASYTKDVTSKGPTFTLRKFTKIPWTPTQMISLNTVSPEMLAYFWILLQYKANILIAGGTGSGKTTLLNALAFFIPPEARVVSIEDSVTGDSRVLIRQKEEIKHIPIKEFVDGKIDAEVLSVDAKGKMVFVKPSAYVRHCVKKDIYEVTTATGRKVKVTQDHSLFTLGENNELQNVKPTELIKNVSHIAVPRLLPLEGTHRTKLNLMEHLRHFTHDFLQGSAVRKIFEQYGYKELGVAKERYRWWKSHDLISVDTVWKLGVTFTQDELATLRIKSKNTGSVPVLFPLTQEFLEFCGLWLGDGSYDNYNGNSVILSNVDEECRHIVQTIASSLGLHYSLMNDGGVSMRIHSTVFYTLMKKVIGLDGYSDTKKLPAFLFSLANEQVSHVLRGYFSADGCIKKYEVSCASQSYTLLEDIQTALLRHGIIGRIQDFTRKDRCMSLSISGSEHVERFKEIGFLQERKQVKLRAMHWHAHHASSDIIPLRENKVRTFSTISREKLQHGYLNMLQHIGRAYMQRIAPAGSEFNDISHTDILWDKVKDVRKVSEGDIEVFDLSIPGYEKFLCNNIFVHNTRELNLPRENWLPAVARPSIGIGKVGEVDLFALLRSSFRQTPDYLIVGEVRGKEAFVLFQGMASGHPSISTMHADSVDTLIRRLQTPPIELSPTLVNSLDCVVVVTHAVIGQRETRRVREVVEIVSVNKDGTALVNTPLIWDPQKDVFYFKKQSKVFEKIAARNGIALDKLQKEFGIRTKLLYELYKRKIFDFDEIGRIVNEYYKNPLDILMKYGIKE